LIAFDLWAALPAIAVGNSAGQFNGTDLQLRLLIENSYREQDADSTVRPGFKPTDCCGTYFDPFPIEHQGWEPLNVFQYIEWVDDQCQFNSINIEI
jgi:hypothetical protein